MIDRHLPSETVVDIAIGGKEQGNLPPLLRFFSLDPKNLSIPEVAIDPIPCHREQLLQIDVVPHPLDLVGGSSVHPDEARPNRPQRVVEWNATASI